MKPENDALKALFDAAAEEINPIDPERERNALWRFLRELPGLNIKQMRESAVKISKKRGQKQGPRFLDPNTQFVDSVFRSMDVNAPPKKRPTKKPHIEEPKEQLKEQPKDRPRRS